MRAFLRRWARVVALVGVVSWPGVVRAQGKIYWTQTPGGPPQVWSVNPDGTGNVNVFPAGLTPPAPFVMGTDVAGPTRGTYPLNPADTASPKAQWFVTYLESPDGNASDIFAFAPDGHGGAVWRRITSSTPVPSDPTLPPPTLRVAGQVQLTPGDEYVTFRVGDLVIDAYGHPTYPARKVVRLASPLTLTAPVGPGTVQVAYQVQAPDQVVQQSPSPDGNRVAARVDHPYPDGNTRPQIRTCAVGAASDTLLVDPVMTDLVPEDPSWSPDGSKIAFVNGRWGSNLGIYTVSPATGAVQAVVLVAKSGGNYNEPYAPLWSPDSKAVALTMIYSYFSFNNYTGSALGTYPVPGAKKDKVKIVGPTLSWPNRINPFGWR